MKRWLARATTRNLTRKGEYCLSRKKVRTPATRAAMLTLDRRLLGALRPMITPVYSLPLPSEMEWR